ncbi:phospholipid scramblase 1-like [Palaemon carinicauda]|uniref:phospholipid scramblase 1-like n=1 Tax=Palaemon carinicauda TaxID=392227 RepID=UPI0035B5EDD3
MTYIGPPGLEYLAQLDTVLVKQKCEVFEILPGCETNNQYILKNNSGYEFFRAVEHTNYCLRHVCGSIRAFDIAFLDHEDQEILHLSRPFRCNSFCCPAFTLQTIEVSCPPGNPLGTVSQEWSFCTPLASKFSLFNASGDKVLRVIGPTCTSGCGDDVKFKIVTAHGSAQIGSITKKWQGYCNESLSEADNFSINFPIDLEIRSKALLLGAMFLIDFMFFERRY